MTYAPGTKVRTTARYYEKFGRMMYGRVAGPDWALDDDCTKYTFVIVEAQTGTVIPEYQNSNLAILMLTSDLEPDHSLQQEAKDA